MHFQRKVLDYTVVVKGSNELPSVSITCAQTARLSSSCVRYDSHSGVIFTLLLYTILSLNRPTKIAVSCSTGNRKRCVCTFGSADIV